MDKSVSLLFLLLATKAYSSGGLEDCRAFEGRWVTQCDNGLKFTSQIYSFDCRTLKLDEKFYHYEMGKTYPSTFNGEVGGDKYTVNSFKVYVWNDIKKELTFVGDDLGSYDNKIGRWMDSVQTISKIVGEELHRTVQNAVVMRGKVYREENYICIGKREIRNSH